MTDRPRSGRRLDFLDALRGVAVALVLVQHVGERLFPAVREFGAHVAQLGQLGVVVFFLCSGFIIPASLERPGDGGRAARLRSFWRSRFFRLYPLYWLSLAGALLLAGLGQGTAAGVLHAGGWLANATMLQGLLGVPHALGIYWTLTYELLFYIGASLLYLAGLHRRCVAVSLAGAAACLAAAVLSGPVLHRPAPLAVFCLATMFTGTVFHRWHSGATSLRALAGCLTATLGSGAVLLVSSLRAGAPGDPEGTRSLVPMLVAWTAAYALFCGGVLLRDRPLPRVLPFLGRISYSAYLMHALVLLAVPALPWPALTAAVWIAVTVLISTLTHRLVELPAVRLGRALGRRERRLVVVEITLDPPAPQLSSTRRAARPQFSSLDWITVHWIERLGRLFGTTGRLLLKELSGFGVVGVVCFFIDVGVFQLLYAHVGTGAVTSKFVSTVVSMTCAYFGHRHWSFSHRARRDIRHEYMLFAVINGSTLLLQLGIVALVRYPMGLDGALPLQIANVFAIGVTTVIRYLSYRRWVFPAHPEAVAAEVTADPVPRNVPDAA